MLKIRIPANEWYDESRSEFIYTKEYTIRLEHSLISLSKWESKWKKPYLNPKESITRDEFIDYIRCMTIDQNIDPFAYNAIPDSTLNEISAYIDDKMTATWFSKEQSKAGVQRGRVVTSELIYYWMIAYNIPADYQKWHLNRLLTLIEVCNAENNPKKMSKQEMALKRKELNELRRKQTGSRG